MARLLRTSMDQTLCLTVNEFEMFETFLRVSLYENKQLGINLELEKNGDAEVMLIMNTEPKNEPSNCVIRIDYHQNDDKEYILDIEFDEINYDNKTGKAVKDDWINFFQEIIGRCVTYASANIKIVIPANSQPIASIDVLGKSYFLYQTEHVERKTPDGKIYHEPGEQFVKLATGIKLDEKILETIQKIPFQKQWLVYGKRTGAKRDTEIFNRMAVLLSESVLKNELDVNVTDIPAMWKLIEDRKIVPIFSLGYNVQQSIPASISIIENILAENDINPKFSPTNLVLV